MQKFSCKPSEGGKISVHRHLTALLKHLENTLNDVCRRCVANAIPYNNTTFINVPAVKGHFGMMCKAYATIMPSNKFRELSFLPGGGRTVCLWGTRIFLGWSKGGPEFFEGQRGGDQKILATRDHRETVPPPGKK